MMSVRKLLVFPLALLMMASSSAFAGQQHVVSPGQLATTVAAGAAKQDTDRTIVREALGQPEVQAIAAKLGLDLSRATAAVDTMSAAELERAAGAAQQVNEQLVGGASTVVISTGDHHILLLVILIIALRSAGPRPARPA
jgi:hypothetical protein